MNKIRFGIIGLGNQGSSYTFNIFDKGSVENGVLAAVCDNNPVKLENVKNNTNNKELAYFENYIEMLDSALCDAVLIETPHYQHPEMVIECLKRGINVICEKPAGVYAKQVREMNEAAEKSGAKFGMMFNQRTNCIYRKMRELVHSGILGQIQRVTWIITDWYRTQFYYDSGAWRATWNGEGGGVLINQCPHQLDLVSWIMGENPKTVRGFCQYGRWHNIEVEDEVTAYFEYENGASGVFITTTGETPGTNRFEISGTRGKLVCQNNELMLYENEEDSGVFNPTDNAFARPKCKITKVETDGKNPQHAGIINNFANALLGLEDFFVDGKEGINGVQLMNAIEYSGWNDGEKVTLPVDEEKYLALLNKKRAESKVVKKGTDIVTNTLGSYGGKK